MNRSSGSRPTRTADALVNVVAVAAVILAGAGPVMESVRDFRQRSDLGKSIRGDWNRLVSASMPLTDTIDRRGYVIEFGDYQCPACRQAHHLTMQLAAELDIAVGYMHLPLTEIHPHAEAAATAAVCTIDHDAFPRMHEALLAAGEWIATGEFVLLASKAGVTDTVAFRQCLKGESARARIQRDRYLAARLGVIGTPTYIGRNGSFTGLPNRAEFERIVGLK